MFSLGSTTIDSVYLGNTKIGAAYLGGTLVYSATNIYNPYNLPAGTFRIQFTDSGFDPTDQQYAQQHREQVWTQVSSSPYVWDCYLDQTVQSPSKKLNTTDMWAGYLTRPSGVILGCNLDGKYSVDDFSARVFTAVKSAYLGTGWTTDNNGPFNGNTYFTEFGDIDWGDWQHVQITSQSVPTTCGNWRLSGTTSIADLLISNETSLVTLPTLHDVGNLASCARAFSGCTNAENGILDAYNVLASSPAAATASAHANAFYNCGANTASGQAALAQIPTSWGGTYDGQNHGDLG